MTLTFTGPAGSEADPATFWNHRLTVEFTHAESGTTYAILGFFAADGHAGSSYADHGDQWQARFTPDRPGT